MLYEVITNSITIVVNNAVSVTPSVSGNVEFYSIAPELPTGVTINSSTGEISGTPTATSAPKRYTITASNEFGSTTAIFELVVNSPTSDYHTIYVTGTLNQFSDMMDQWNGEEVKTGDSFTASFSYDRNTTDNNSPTDVGDYWYIDPNCLYVLEINNMVFKSKVCADNNLLEIINRPNCDVLLFRTYDCETPYSGYVIEWQMNDNTGTTFDSDVIPERFDFSKFSGTVTIYNYDMVYFGFSAASISQSGNEVGVPTALITAEENQSKVYISDNRLTITNVKEKSDIYIYDLKGNLLVTEEYSGKSINIGNFAKGIYIVRHTSVDGSLVSSKIMR